jgi:hypothetical protein
MKIYGEMKVYFCHFWSRLWMEVSGQLRVPIALPPAKEPPIPIGFEARWVPQPAWTLWNREKYFLPAGNWTPAVQPIARRYTDLAISAPITFYTYLNLKCRSSFWQPCIYAIVMQSFYREECIRAFLSVGIVCYLCNLRRAPVLRFRLILRLNGAAIREPINLAFSSAVWCCSVSLSCSLWIDLVAESNRVLKTVEVPMRKPGPWSSE